MTSVRTFALACLTIGLFTAIDGHAQSKATQSKSTKAAASSKKVDAKYRRLPSYFGQLKLKEEQRNEVYEIKAEYGPKIEELEKQLEKLREEMMKEIEGTLTTTQKRALTKFRNGTGTSTTKKVGSKSANVTKKTDTDKEVSRKSSSSKSGSKSGTSKK